MRSLRSLFIAVLLVLSAGVQPALVAGAGHAPPPPPAIPALDRSGPIVLPNGKVLPVPPTGALRPSPMADALAAHASDHLTFTPGSRPRDLGTTPTASLSLATAGSGSNAELIPLATGTPVATLASLPNGLKKQVFGFLPYWMLNASSLQWLRYDLVSTIAYFGVAARSDGSLVTTGSTWSGWNSSYMTNVTNAAHARGDKVVLTITMMAWDASSSSAMATLLGNSTYRARLVSNIVATIANRHADGVNLDFEPVSSTLRSQYTSFVRQLKAALVSAGRPFLTVCTMAGAATWATGYDVAGLTASGAADALFVMGYDYSWSGSSRAGGVDPMTSSYMLDVNQSVNDYLSLTSGSRIIWGVPYYGRTWLTTSNALNATTVSGASGSSKAYYYTGAKSLAATYGRRWDSLGLVPWFTYQNSSGQWVEGYYDDATSLGIRYDMVNRRGLAGMGMWHLLMDAGVSDLWNLIANKFQNDTVPPSGGIATLPPVTDASAIGVRWRAIDVGSGVASYTVQVRDRATTTWATWLTGTTAIQATYIGTPGHAYEFRVAARDRLGNTQPWVPAMADPGATLTPGGFARVTASLLNVRAGAGTGFEQLAQLAAGARVAILSGPVAAGGYSWYQVQFAFTEWPSADYPRTGWAAAGDSTGAWMVPDTAPTVTSLRPWITGYAPMARVFSPNGDGRYDTVGVAFTLSGDASDVRLDVLSSQGTVVDSTDLGARSAGANQATWDGHLSGGGWAPGGTYLLRLTATASGATHVAPTSGVDGTILGRWGVTADVTPPRADAVAPTGQQVPSTTVVTAHFSEPVSGVSASSFSLYDITASAYRPATVTYDAATRKGTLQPQAALPIGHQYRASLGSAIRDGVGNALSPTSWTFTVPNLVWYYNPPRALSFAAGSHTGYKFDSTGKVIAAKTCILYRASSASTSQRSRLIPGHSGAWFYVTNGLWAGYWLPESPTVYLPGIAEQVIYTTPRTVSFLAGTYTGVKFSSTWSISATKAYRLSRSSSASAGRWAVINGRSYVLILNGIWAGYWMPTGGGVTVN